MTLSMTREENASHRRILLLACALVSLALPSFASAQQLPRKPVLDLASARKIAAAAEAEASRNSWNVVIAIVDDGGHLVYLQRMDGTQTASVEIAQQKARTAAGFRRPTKAFGDRIAAGDHLLLALPGATPLEGGIPITVDGHVVGAIGVSGVTSQQDGQIAQAGIAALGGAR